MISRVFIIDHMCALPYGHNLGAMLLFKKKMIGKYDEIICLASKELSTITARLNGIENELYFPYAGYFDTKTKATYKLSIFPSFFFILPKLLKRITYIGLANIPKYNHILHQTVLDWRRIFQKYSIGENDFIFFPSADYFGCISLFKFLLGVPECKRPKIHLRLIGVMEYATYKINRSKYYFFDLLGYFHTLGIKFTISAETPIYASFICKNFDMKVTYMPYPLMHDISSMRWEHVKMISFPGQGRVDKGFYRILSLINEIKRCGYENEFRFDVQNMRITDPKFRKNYQNALQNVPNMRLRECTLSIEEINEMYKESDILILPYDSETYALRGSAVYQEGISSGRPIICSKGTGVAELVERYGNGLLAEGDSDFAHKIIELSQRSKSDIMEMTWKAREKYRLDVEDGISKIFC